MNQISPELAKLIQEGAESPAKFAETLLIDPRKKETVKLLWPQRFVLESTHRNTYIYLHRRAGKAVPLTSTVYTPFGPKCMGDIRKGSLVCTPDGSRAYVQEIFPQ